MRVLICNDDLGESAALARLVSYAGHDPVVVAHPERARAALVAGEVEVAVLDLDRHEDATIELVRLSNTDGRRVSTLLVATEPAARLIIECHRLGATDFVLRPLSRGEFRGIFDRICDRICDRNFPSALSAQATLPAGPIRVAASALSAQATLPAGPIRVAASALSAQVTLSNAPVERPSSLTPSPQPHAPQPQPHAPPLQPVAPASAVPARHAPSRPPESGAPIVGAGGDDRPHWPDDGSGAHDHSWASTPLTETPVSSSARAGGSLPPLPTPARPGGVPFEDINADPLRSEARIRHFLLTSEGSLPVPGRVVARLARLESEESPDFDQLVEIVESNAMTVRSVMRKASSVEQYRGQPPLKTVRECVTRLGTRRVISAAMAASVRVNLDVRAPDVMRVFGAIWVAQYVASRVAERLCQHLHIAPADAVQNRVLFMDMGEMVICRAAVEFWPHEMRGGQMSVNLLRFMHDNVRTIGAHTLRLWGMPEDFAAMARRDARLSGETSRPNVSRLHIALASAHAARHCLGPGAGIPPADPVTFDLWNRLGVTEASVHNMADEMLVSTRRLLQG